MTSVPSNLIPTRITQLPEYTGASTLGFVPYVFEGITYKAQISSLISAGEVPSSRIIATGNGLAGGGNLSADRTISLILSSFTPQSVGAASPGTATVAAREDHVHPAVDLTDTTETSGVLPMSRGGTGGNLTPAAGAILYSGASGAALSAVGSSDQVLFSTGSGAPAWRTVTAGTGVSITHAAGSMTVTNTAPDQVVTLTAGSNVTITGTYPSFTIAATGGGGGGSGTVTSVDVSGGTTGLTFTGGPITTSGTITAGGTLAVANGGTGQTTYSNGQLLIGKTDGTLAKATLAAGTGVSITNGDGSVTVTNSAPDQTVVLTAGTGISTSGAYPNFTITNSAPDQTVSLTGAGTTSISGTYPNFTITSNDQFVGTVTSVSGTGSVNGITLTGTVTSSGSLTLGGTLSNVSLATQVTGTLPVANGGTGATTLTGVVIGNGTSAFTTKTNPAGDFVGTTDTQTLSGKTINGAILNDGYTEEVFAITDGGTVNLDPNNGSIQTWTLGANRTPGEANWAAGQSITLMVDDGSAFTITWTTLDVIWETDGGTAPTLALTGFTVIVLWKVGTQIYGARVGDA